MPQPSIAKYLNPWKYRREQEAERLTALRRRDGDNCARCRRPMRFDLSAGHDHAPKIEHLQPGPKGGAVELDDLCLCHGHCNRLKVDATPEVTERVRRKNEAELFAKARKRRAA
jgi:hypothetical protein